MCVNFQTTMDRPIVVNSLLCFIHNFRSHPLLNVLTQRYFSKSLFDTAKNTLIDILADQIKEPDESELQDFTLIELFDKVISTLNPIPLFVAADLTTLPMVLISDQNQSKSVIDEIHQLRFYIQSTFSPENQTKKCPSSYFSAMSSNNIIINDINDKEMASDRASPINLTITPKRESPSLRISKTPQLLHVEQIQQHQKNCKSEISAECLSQSNSPISTPKKLRKHAPYRLDKAVRKLTDRLEATKDTVSPKKSSSTPPPSSATAADENAIVQNRSTSAELLPHDTSSNTSSTENHKPNEECVATSGGSFLNPPAALNGHFDPITFMMLKNLATNHSALKNHAIKSSRNNVSDTISVDATSVDDMDDDDDKMSNESSPTPSDSSNGKEYKSENEKHHSNGSSNGGGGKPFTCTQPNCTKSFANKFLLKKHQFIHTGLRPHVCPFCAKRFNRKDNLLRHKKTHMANAALQLDGRRRHHALLSPAPATFDPLALLKISSHTQNNNEESEGVKYEAISP